MHTISATEFRARCLAVLDEVRRTGEPITVLRRGQAVAVIRPHAEEDEACLPPGIAGSVPILRPFDGRWPVLGEGAWLAPSAVVVGDVVLGPDTTVWYGAVVRGDTNRIRIGAGTNVQDLAVVHTTRVTHPSTLGDRVTVGHHAMLHGCTVEDGALIGIGARVLDGAVVGEESVVAAGALVPPGARIPPRTLAVGMPARVRRKLTDDELAYNRETAASYVLLAARHRAVDGQPTPDRPR